MDPVVDAAPRPGKQEKLLDQTRGVLRLKHYSLRTEQAYFDHPPGNEGPRSSASSRPE